jgi:hypothetical protein
MFAGSSPHPMDVWVDTNISSIPICPKSDSDYCRSLFPKHTDTPPSPFVVSRIRCFRDVSVPEYFAAEATNLTSASGLTNGQGHFSVSVCICNPEWGLLGKGCGNGPMTHLLNAFLSAIALWVVYITWRLLRLYRRGHFKTRRKRFLAAVSIVQMCGHILWLTSTHYLMVMIRIVELQGMLRVLGIGLAFSAIFLFLCTLLLDMSDFIRQDMERHRTTKQSALICILRLKRLDVFLKMLPPSMLIATVILREHVAILAVVFSVCSGIVACAFTIVIRILNSKVRRLMPQSQPGSLPATNGT